MDFSSVDKKLALAMEPLFNGINGGKLGKMKTFTEVKFDLIENWTEDTSNNPKKKRKYSPSNI